MVGTDGAGVNLRAAPSLSAARIATVPEGAVLLAVDDPRESEGRTWRPVRDPEQNEGWVAAEFLAPV